MPGLAKCKFVLLQSGNKVTFRQQPVAVAVALALALALAVAVGSRRAQRAGERGLHNESVAAIRSEQIQSDGLGERAKRESRSAFGRYSNGYE